TGAIHTSWFVDPVDAVGSTLQVTAVGETSHAAAQATFTDSGSPPRPFWIWGHNPNTIADAEANLQNGANALEPDVQAWPNGSDPITHDAANQHDGLAIAHDPDGSASRVNLVSYLQGLSSLADQYPSFAAVVFDVKHEAADPDSQYAPAVPYV